MLGLLGRGGKSEEVMLARRADGAWEGEAAIKVLRRGMDSAAILARFALEQRALGRLSPRTLPACSMPAAPPTASRIS